MHAKRFRQLRARSPSAFIQLGNRHALRLLIAGLPTHIHLPGDKHTNPASIFQHLNGFGLRSSFKQIVLTHSKTPPFGDLLPHLRSPQKHKKLFSQTISENPCKH
jgi:hypothetical protein